MPRYIDAEKINYRTDHNSSIYDNCGGHCCQVGYDQVASYSEIREIPTADVAPVIHAHWIKHDKTLAVSFGESAVVGQYFECSACGRTEDHEEPYCNCGAKMDEEEK